MKESIRNQWYMVKFCMEASPLHFLYHIVICVGLEIFIFWSIRYGSAIIWTQQSRTGIFKSSCHDSRMVVLLAFHQLCTPSISTGQRRRSSRCCIRSRRRAFGEKPKRGHCSCYDDPQHYNEFILSITQANPVH